MIVKIILGITLAYIVVILFLKWIEKNAKS